MVAVEALSHAHVAVQQARPGRCPDGDLVLQALGDPELAARPAGLGKVEIVAVAEIDPKQIDLTDLLPVGLGPRLGNGVI